MPPTINTQRDQEIIRLALENYSGAEIAERFGISRERVRVIVTKSGIKLRSNLRTSSIRRPVRRTFSERYWARVSVTDDPNECWLWTPATKDTTLGYYGALKGLGRTWLSHQAAWYFARRPRPKLWILHKCGNSLCCNPNHLYEGTPKQNSADRVLHGTSLRGEEVSVSKINNETVVSIKRRIKSQNGKKLNEISRDFGLPYNLVWRIKSGLCWGWLNID